MESIDFSKIHSIHFIGIGGISMSGIAIIMKKFGYTVTGSDITENDMVKIVKSENIPLSIGPNIENVLKADIVVYTAAIPKNDAELLAAKNANILTIERAVFLGNLLKQYDKPICIAGMHGKTTTTSMVSNILKVASLAPTILVGSKLRELNNLNYEIGNNEYFVLESCEYVDSFLNFPGNTSVILNLEAEHLDYFKTFENIKKSFAKFIGIIQTNGNLVINIDDENCAELLKNVDGTITQNNIHVYTFSVKNANATLYAKNISLMENGCYEFDAIYNGSNVAHIKLSAPGKHNIYNALASTAVAIANNIDLKYVSIALEEFTGANRRFEFKKCINGNVEVYDDYAHHPTEIKATLATAKEKGKNKIYAVFQPHTYSRLKTLFDEFTDAFFDADVVIITDIYAAREIDDGTISSQMLVDSLNQKGVNAIYISDFKDIATYLNDNTNSNDIILTIGAGTITELSDIL